MRRTCCIARQRCLIKFDNKKGGRLPERHERPTVRGMSLHQPVATFPRRTDTSRHDHGRLKTLPKDVVSAKNKQIEKAFILHINSAIRRMGVDL